MTSRLLWRVGALNVLTSSSNWTGIAVWLSGILPPLSSSGAVLVPGLISRK